MKKNLLLILPILALIGSSTAHAVDGQSATLQLQGTVSSRNEISVTPIGSLNMNLNVLQGETAKHVADATEVSNSSTGYKIRAKSQNVGFLVNWVSGAPATAYGSARKVAWELIYDNDTAHALTDQYSLVKITASLSQLISYSSPISVNVQGAADLPSGDYYDLATFEISKN